MFLVQNWLVRTFSNSPSSRILLTPSSQTTGILATSDAPSRAYAQWTQKACEAVGIEYELRELERAEGMEKASEDMVEEAILTANGEKEVDGIMVYVSALSACGDGVGDGHMYGAEADNVLLFFCSMAV